MYKYKAEEIIKSRSRILRLYFDQYKIEGFVNLPPMPMVNSKDATLDFTNCTICNAKNNIKNDSISKDFITFQPSIRTNNLEAYKNTNEDTRYTTYFTMMGGYKYLTGGISDHLNEFCKILIHEAMFLKLVLGDKKIILTFPSGHLNKLQSNNDTLKYFEKNNVEIKESLVDDEKLKWKYGIREVIGYGTRWEVMISEKNVVNWGNTILVFKNNNPIGIDFGGGLETLIKIDLELPHLIYANSYSNDYVLGLLNKGKNWIKYIDLIIGFQVMLSESYTLSTPRIKYTIDLYARFIAAYTYINEVTDEELYCLISNIYNNDIHKKNVEFDEHLRILQKKMSILISIKRSLKRFDSQYIDKYLSKLFNVEIEAINMIC